VRWGRVAERVNLLAAAGGTVLAVVDDQQTGRPDRVVMADPEGNEFRVL
jgi:hypothetical protein